MKNSISVDWNKWSGKENNGPITAFLSIWFVAGLVFNYFTEVSGEEAYYWLFSQKLEWGYLDHPPMVAFIIKPGYWLFQNNMGLRLGLLILSILTILIIRKTLAVQNDRVYIWVLLGLLPVHLGTVIVKTDIPLLFFTAAFYWLYKQYVEADQFTISFLLAACIACMILSKYHGFLIVFFTVLSNVSLFKKKSFYVVIVLSVLFLLPHFYWQYRNDFASVRFHLYNRDDMGFRWSNLLNYVWMQPVFLGPFISFILIAASIKLKTASIFHRTLRFTIAGVFLFFFFSAFKLEIHKHWTSILIVPLILLGHEHISAKKKWQNVTKYVAVFSLSLILLFRIYLAYNFLPASVSKKIEKLHDWSEWSTKIEKLSNGLPVMFINQYDQASRFSYLTKKETHCYNTVHYRETQHDLWLLEDSLQNKDVFAVMRYEPGSLLNVDSSVQGIKIQYKKIKNFRSLRKITVQLIEKDLVAKSGQTLAVNGIFTNNYNYAVHFSEMGNRDVFLNAHFFQGSSSVLDKRLDTLTNSLKTKEQFSKKINLIVPSKPGVYDLRFSIQVEGIEPPVNSHKIKVRVL